MDKQEITKDILIELYINQYLTLREVADKLGWSRCGIRNKLKSYNIYIRPLNEARRPKEHVPSHPLLQDKDFLYQKYVVEQLSLRDIAKQIETAGRRSIKRALIYHGIPVRDLIDARNNRSDKGPELRTADNPLANDLDYLSELYEEHKSLRTVSKLLGISKTALRHRFKIANIKIYPSSQCHMGTKHSLETKAKMSNTAAQQIVDGTRPGHGKGKRILVTTPNQGVIYVRSSYEAAYVDYLNSNNIDFMYEHTKFTLSNGRSYVPDFFLTKTEEYIEIKGYLEEVSAIKLALFQAEYPDVKWSIKYKYDLEMLGIDLKKGSNYV